MTAPSAAPTSAPPTALTHRQIMVVLSGLLLGMFLASLDQTIVSTDNVRGGRPRHGIATENEPDAGHVRAFAENFRDVTQRFPLR